MAHHKRHRRRKIRAGCKFCKPWKVGGISIENKMAEAWSAHRRRMAAKADIREVLA